MAGQKRQPHQISRQDNELILNVPKRPRTAASVEDFGKLQPFWATTRHMQQDHKPSPMKQASACTVSLGRWGAVCSGAEEISLAPVSFRCQEHSDDDTEDTATSSSSNSMGSVADCHQGATNNKAADDGDSINSKQQPAHNAAFSFGHRPLIAPDLSCTENWEMVGALLALCGT